jgi:hypothetical protein
MVCPPAGVVHERASRKIARIEGAVRTSAFALPRVNRVLPRKAGCSDLGIPQVFEFIRIATRKHVVILAADGLSARLLIPTSWS